MEQKKKPYFIESCLPLAVMLLLIYFGNIKNGIKTQPLILLSAVFTFILAQRIGLKWSDVQKEIQRKFGKAIPSILILISVGFVISTWMASGTIPMMIYYGIKMVSPKLLILTAFIVTAIVSMCTGTSWGSVGTMGVAIMGVAIGLGVNLPMVAGAVISGAYFGDKLSPLSDTTNMAPIYAGSELYEHIGHMLYTTVPASVLCIVVYLILGFNPSATGSTQSDIAETILNTITSAYHLNILLLIPVIIVLGGAIMKFSSLPVMSAASIIAGIEAVLIQGISVKNVINCSLSGFSVDMIAKEGFDSEQVADVVTTLLERGGMSSIMSTTLTVFSAFVFASVLTSGGYLDVILEKMLVVVKSTGALVTSTVASCWITAMVTGSSNMTLLVNGELFAPVYKKMGLAPKNLSRTLEDAGTVVVPLIPWGSAGGYMAATLGIPTLSYAPWAILCYSCSIIAIILAFTGFGIAKADRQEGQADV